MVMRTVQFLAVFLTALALVPAGAHLLELPNKLALQQADYMTVQGIYRGWALLGAVWAAALLANAALAFLSWRHQQAGRWFALVATLLLVAAFFVFFSWTYPANVATANWTVAPANWETLRAQWENSHAATAVVLLAALIAVILAVLGDRRRGAA